MTARRLASIGHEGPATIALVASLGPGPTSVIDISVATPAKSSTAEVRLDRHVTLDELDTWLDELKRDVTDRTETAS